VVAVQKGRASMTELCRRFGISRKTGYKIWNRFKGEGIDGLRDRPTTPHSRPNRSSPELEAAVLRVRKKYPTWGSKKILAMLDRDRESRRLPARSTVDAILKRAGVVTPRSRRRRGQRTNAAPVVEAARPNDAWSIDYKGWFRVGDRTRCDPLTVNDVCSRASLVIEALVSPKLEDVQARLEMAFRTYGLPSMMLSDNGPPFGSNGAFGFSRLSVWLLRLGVKPVFIQPGHPEQNGRHERFHETLKAETANPPKATIRRQQRAFDEFQTIYNDERPHEAIEMHVPAELYELSNREMPSKLEDYSYADDRLVRRVRYNGSIRWAGGFFFVGEAFRGELLGVEIVGDDRAILHLGDMPLATLHVAARTVVPLLS
jgi:transposase InsO family protein